MAGEAQGVNPDERWVCPDCETKSVAFNPVEDECDYVCTHCGGYCEDRPPRPLRTYHQVEFTGITRYLLQVEVDTEEEARACADEVVRDGSCADMAIMDEDRPVVLVDSIDSSRETYFYAGSSFGDRATWLRRLAEQIIKEADALDAAKATVTTD